jgi:N-acetylglucosamine kinase-like BadF-type ATPase
MGCSNVGKLKDYAMAKYVIAVDGGGTKTVGLLADQAGAVLANAEAGGSNAHALPLNVVKKNLSSLVSQLISAAGIEPGQVAGICLGLAGIDRPADKVLISNIVTEFLPLAKILAMNDSVIALIGGCLKPYGIIVIAGTGSIAYGINKEGKDTRAGGWGHILGDEGSGYAIGLKALRAVCRAHDGRGAQTRLKELILKALGLNAPEDLIGWVKEIGGDKGTVGNLAPFVLEAFEQDDEVAKQILEAESYELALTADAVRRKLFSPDDRSFDIVVGGTNLRKSNLYLDLFRNQIEKFAAGVSVLLPKEEPVVGAKIHILRNLQDEDPVRSRR